MAGPDAVVEAHPALIISVFTPAQEVLVALEVGPLVHHPVSTLHPDGVATGEVRVQLSTVIAALIGATLEVSLLKKDDLGKKNNFSP